jgi:hypothetical protein
MSKTNDREPVIELRIPLTEDQLNQLNVCMTAMPRRGRFKGQGQAMEFVDSICVPALALAISCMTDSTGLVPTVAQASFLLHGPADDEDPLAPTRPGDVPALQRTP